MGIFCGLDVFVTTAVILGHRLRTEREGDRLS